MFFISYNSLEVTIMEYVPFETRKKPKNIKNVTFPVIWLWVINGRKTCKTLFGTNLDKAEINDEENRANLVPIYPNKVNNGKMAKTIKYASCPGKIFIWGFLTKFMIRLKYSLNMLAPFPKEKIND